MYITDNILFAEASKLVTTDGQTTSLISGKTIAYRTKAEISCRIEPLLTRSPDRPEFNSVYLKKTDFRTCWSLKLM